jgi:hypothetical protein
MSLSRPEIDMATALLDRAANDFQTNPTAAAKTYNIEVGKTANDAIAALTNYVASSIGEREELTFDLKYAIYETLRLLVTDVSNLSAQDWLRLFPSARTGTLGPSLINAVVTLLVAEPIRTSLAADPARPSFDEQRLLEVVRNELVSWITQQIGAIAEASNGDVKQMLSAPDWAAELEKRRRSFRSTPLPPGAPASRFSIVRRARRRATKNQRPGGSPPIKQSAKESR